jgi:hypothetical protein
MARTLLLADEIALPTTTGTATSFAQATVVRLANPTANDHVITVVETQSGAGIGSMTLLSNTVEYLEKSHAHCVFSDSALVLGAKVGFTV